MKARHRRSDLVLRGALRSPGRPGVARREDRRRFWAAIALASGQDLEEALGELAKVLVQAGRDHHEMLRAELLPVAGNA